MKRSRLVADPVRAAERAQRREQRRATEPPRPEDLNRELRRAARQDRRANDRLRGSCFCGCKRPAVHRHHVIYAQELRRVVADGRSLRMALPAPDREHLAALVSDPRNLVAVAFECHGAHHGRSVPYELSVLPDSVFEFAAEVLGPRAHGYLRRRYAGRDARLDELRLIAVAS